MDRSVPLWRQRLRSGLLDLSTSSPLGRAVLGAEEGDEIEFQLDDGRQRKASVENVQKSFVGAAVPRQADGDAATAPT